ncbi:MAG: class I SAM-dependent methyltransferase [Candidatus Micrarchaeota archaeon]
MKVYDDMSEYYDLIYGDMLDLKFYTQEAKNTRGSVLEIACGTGRILLSLLSENIDVCGIDISDGMLNTLKEKAKQKGVAPNVIKADMLDFKLDKKFKLIIVPYRSFLHLKTIDERKKALANFRNHLDKEGRLILHTYNPSEEEYGMVDGLHKFASEELISPDGKSYRIEWYLEYKPKTKTGHYEIDLHLDGKEHHFEMEIAYLNKNEMIELLKSGGYKNIKAYCGFDYMPFNDNCKEAVWIADF